MKLGCCLNMFSNPQDTLGLRYLPLAQNAGYDYLEMPLAQVAELDGGQFAAVADTVKKSGLPCRACNNCLPGTLKITGPAVDGAKIDAYLKLAFERAHVLGAEIIVFGSAGAKNVPEGFSRETAFTQIVSFLQKAAPIAASYGIVIAIEPLNGKESNIILNMTEGAALLEAVNNPNVRLLVDYYHHRLENESNADIARYGKYLVHTHFSEPEGRVYPAGCTKEYESFVTALKAAGYDGRMSAEAFSKDPERDIPLFPKLFARFR